MSDLSLSRVFHVCIEVLKDLSEIKPTIEVGNMLLQLKPYFETKLVKSKTNSYVWESAKAFVKGEYVNVKSLVKDNVNTPLLTRKG